jgi:hypothetical protein
MSINVFAPKRGETVNIAATATSASVTLSDSATNSSNMRVYNAGPSTVFLRVGVAAQTASATADMPIPAGGVENFYKGKADTVAAVCASGGTATVYLTPGEGV